MNLKRRLRRLQKKVVEREGASKEGALRDMLTDMIHLCREQKFDPGELFALAVKVADEEKDDEKEKPE